MSSQGPKPVTRRARRPGLIEGIIRVFRRCLNKAQCSNPINYRRTHVSIVSSHALLEWPQLVAAITTYSCSMRCQERLTRWPWRVKTALEPYQVAPWLTAVQLLATMTRVLLGLSSSRQIAFSQTATSMRHATRRAIATPSGILVSVDAMLHDDIEQQSSVTTAAEYWALRLCGTVVNRNRNADVAERKPQNTTCYIRHLETTGPSREWCRLQLVVAEEGIGGRRSRTLLTYQLE